MLTIADVLKTARQQIEPASDTASLDAQLLLSEVLGKPRAYLLAHGEIPLSEEQAARYTAMVQRRATGEPVGLTFIGDYLTDESHRELQRACWRTRKWMI